VTQPRPFRSETTEEQLADLRSRLAGTRFAPALSGTDWTHGTPPGYLAELADYWRNEFDWRAERQLNELPRIAVWGSSFSGAHAFVVAAIDQRVKAVCGQAPFVSGQATFGNVARENNQVIGTDPSRVTGIPTPDAFDWFTEAHETLAPEWHNEVTLRSLELLRATNPLCTCH
jgi:hypothetical protein